MRGDLTWGDEKLNIKVGGNYDDMSRRIRGFDNSQAWQNAVCGDNPNVFVPSPNSQPPCEGLNAAGTPAPAGYPTYPGYGTGLYRRQDRPGHLWRFADPDVARLPQLSDARAGRLRHGRLARRSRRRSQL